MKEDRLFCNDLDTVHSIRIFAIGIQLLSDQDIHRLMVGERSLKRLYQQLKRALTIRTLEMNIYSSRST